MVFNATFHNISAISWWPVLLGGNQSTQKVKKKERKEDCWNSEITFSQFSRSQGLTDYI